MSFTIQIPRARELAQDLSRANTELKRAIEAFEQHSQKFFTTTSGQATQQYDQVQKAWAVSVADMQTQMDKAVFWLDEAIDNYVRADVEAANGIG